MITFSLSFIRLSLSLSLPLSLHDHGVLIRHHSACTCFGCIPLSPRRYGLCLFLPLSLPFFPGSVFHLVFSLPVYAWTDGMLELPDSLHGKPHTLSDRISHIPPSFLDLVSSQTCISDEFEYYDSWVDSTQDDEYPNNLHLNVNTS